MTDLPRPAQTGGFCCLRWPSRSARHGVYYIDITHFAWADRDKLAMKINFREGFKRLLVLISLASIAIAAWHVASNGETKPRNIGPEQQALAKCLGFIKASSVQYKNDNGVARLLAMGRMMSVDRNPYDAQPAIKPGKLTVDDLIELADRQTAEDVITKCKYEADSFLGLAQEHIRYKKDGTVSYFIRTGEVISVGAVLGMWLSALWIGFFTISWVLSGFSKKEDEH